MRNITWNDKVSKNRGESWKAALVKGKLEAKLNPTKLQLVRANKNLSQNKVAKDLKMSLATYGAIERAKRPVSSSKAGMLCQYFGKSQGALFKKHEKGRLIAK